MGVGVGVEMGVAVGISVAVGVGVAVAVGVGMGVGVGVEMGVAVGISVAVGVGVAVAVGVGMGVGVGVEMGVAVGISVAVGVGAGVSIGVGVGVGVGSSEHPARRMARSAVATTSRPIAGLCMRLLPPLAFQAHRSRVASCIFDDGDFIALYDDAPFPSESSASGQGVAVAVDAGAPSSYESPAASMIQFPSSCLLALKLYVTPLMVVLRASIPVPAVKNRNLPVPDESTVNSVDVPG